MEMLSICMIVRDEEENLDRCLSSLKRLRDAVPTELIIIDTGSKDRTVDIAHKYTDKVFIHPWENDFALMRNKSIDYANGQWIMVIDADEEMVNPEGIIDCLTDDKITSLYKALVLSVKDFPKKSDKEIFFEYLLPRVFKNMKNFRYEGSVHEQPMYEEPSYVVEGEGLHHYGYNSEDEGLIAKKTERMSDLLLAKLKENPEDIYYLYQLAVTYRMGMAYEKGFLYIEKAYRLIPQNTWDDYSYVVKHYVLMLRDLNQESKILMVEEKLKGKMTFGIDLAYMIGEAFYKLGKFSQAEYYYEYYLERIKSNAVGKLVKENMTDAVITSCYQDSVLVKLFNIALGSGNLLKAISCFKKVPQNLYTEDFIKDVVFISLKLEDKYTFETLTGKVQNSTQIFKETVIEAVESYGEIYSDFSIGTYQDLIKTLNPMYEILLLARDLYKKGQKVNSSELIQFFNNTIQTENLCYSDFLYFAMKNGENIFETLASLPNERIEKIATRLGKYEDLKVLTIQLIAENRIQEAIRPITCFEWVLLENEKGYEKDNQIGFDLLLNKIECLYKSYQRNVLKDSLVYLPRRDRVVAALNSMIKGDLSEIETAELVEKEKNQVWEYLYRLAISNKGELYEEVKQIENAYH